MAEAWQLEAGARLRGDGMAEFRVWAPAANRIVLKLWRAGVEAPEQKVMQRVDSMGSPIQEPDGGSWNAVLEASAGDLYQYQLEYPGAGEMSVPDPVARLLPEGVHGRTEIVDPKQFKWTDAKWRGIPIEECVFYELHVATFTPQGTLDAAIDKLDYLRDVGVTAIEVMPVNAFPGVRNWGYDGVGLFAVQASYGGPEALRRFVDAAHARGLGVILDVVYNHLGNEGNYLRAFGPYFTHKHLTPWGDAVNFDDVGAEGVRRFFVDNALYWVSEYHIDGLRLDAVHQIKDESEEHIVAEIARRVHELGAELGRRTLVIAETDENDARYALPREEGGYGADAFWSDDFHHAAHVLLSGESQGYYEDFRAKPPKELLARALNEGYAYQGEYAPFFGRKRGTPTRGLRLQANVICLQNHDQVGNRALGDRLWSMVPRGAHKMMAAVQLLAPETPLIFMGEEYGEEAPFQFFSDFGDPVIQKAVTEGRCKEFSHFDPKIVPDPQNPETFERSRLRWDLSGWHGEMLEWYKALLRLRRECVMNSARTCKAEWVDEYTLVMRVPASEPRLIVVASFGGKMEWLPEEEFELRLVGGGQDFRVGVFQRLEEESQLAGSRERVA